VNEQVVPAPERVEAALRRWLQEHGIASHDPYDGLACAAPWSLVRRHRLTARLWTQLIKRSPINLRPFVGIEPRVSSKSLADLAAAALLRHRLGMDPEALAVGRRLLTELHAAILPGHAGACWGMPTAYVTRYIDAAAGTPNLFWSLCAASSYLDAFELERDPQDLAVARSVIDFVLHDLGCVDEGEDGVWFRYFARHEAAVINVTAQSAALLLRLARHTAESELAALGRRALRFVLAQQNADGSWFYARGPQGRWVDGFHTGYVLEALLQASRLEGSPEVSAALVRGEAFYRQKMFIRTHLPCYFPEHPHPIEVQNCAQAIQTLARLCWLQPDRIGEARDVAAAVTRALFRYTGRPPEAGYFLMSRGRWWTNRLPVVRWGQAPMLLAYTSLLAAARRLPPSWELDPPTR
jgi:hypothetical protein